MSTKTCPNCGIHVPAGAENCSCGFTFVEYDDDTPGPGVVRGTERPEGAMAPQPAAAHPGDPERAARTPTPPARPRPAAVSPAQPVPPAQPAPPRPAAAGRREGMLIDCPSCDARISKRADSCPKCGASPYADCQVCSTRMLAGTSPCPECGDPDPFNLGIR